MVEITCDFVPIVKKVMPEFIDDGFRVVGEGKEPDTIIVEFPEGRSGDDLLDKFFKRVQGEMWESGIVPRDTLGPPILL